MTEKEKIEKALKNNPSLNIKGVGVILGISRNTLYKRIKKFNIDSKRKMGRPYKAI